MDIKIEKHGFQMVAEKGWFYIMRKSAAGMRRIR